MRPRRQELLQALQDAATPEAMAWLVESATPDEARMFRAFSSAPRHFPHEPIGYGSWTQAEAARVELLLAYSGTDADSYVVTCDRLCQAADVRELVAFYKALPLLPWPDRHALRAAEGVRSNITDVFCAVAHDNPYPSEHFDDVAWNTMVLKALFIGVELAPIVGLDERANPALMRMLCDYAHERWAAGRTVSPELWRCVGPCADDAAIADLERVIATGTPEEKEAAERALASRKES
ncbi:MAG: EboA domain-containing protein [Planctomycetota bacterium]